MESGWGLANFLTNKIFLPQGIGILGRKILLAGRFQRRRTSGVGTGDEGVLMGVAGDWEIAPLP
jgi:hypothetical protein